MATLSLACFRAALACAGALVLAACDSSGSSASPEAVFNAFEKSVFCDVGPTDEVVGLHMPQTAASARYVETLRHAWSRESAVVRSSECHSWDDTKRIAELRSVEVSPGKWRLEAATARPGYFKPMTGMHIARMDSGDLKVVAGNP